MKLLLQDDLINAGVICSHTKDAVLERTPGKIMGIKEWVIPKGYSYNVVFTEPDVLYRYYKTIIYAERVGLMHTCPALYAPKELIEKIPDEQLRPENEQRSLEVKTIAYRDLCKVHGPIALTAWLTNDEFRWHKIDKSIPEDLSYGLVNQYPDFVLTYGLYLSGLQRTRIERDLLTSELEQKLDGYAMTALDQQLSAGN